MTIALLLGAAGFVGGGGWLGLQTILDPDAAIWLNRFLPAWTRIPLTYRNSLQTLEEIRAEVSQAGLTAGETIALTPSSGAFKEIAGDLLLPVWQQRQTCDAADCQQLMELRVYRPTQAAYGNRHDHHFQLVNQVTITGPDESFVISPLVNARAVSPGSVQALPLTRLERWQNSPEFGVWLNLNGTWAQSGATIAYGVIVHYNPARAYLSVMSEWTSTTGQPPVWQASPTSRNPELIVDQTVGLEPKFQIFQVKPRRFLLNPIQLETVSLNDPALDDRTYRNALILARSQLWSPALKQLLAVKQRSRGNPKLWTKAAQAQLELIQLHAQSTQAQADKPWASPSQQVLASIIDGRWSQAIQIFQGTAENRPEIVALLQSDTGRLLNRVIAALRVNPTDPDVQAWGALLLAAKQGQPQAIAWLKKQPRSAANLSRIYILLNQLDIASPREDNLSGHPSQIIGTARPLLSLNPASWFRPNPAAPLKLEPNQVWYQVQVLRFSDGKRWRRSPFPTLKIASHQSTQKLWEQLGINADAQLQLLQWTADGQQQSTSATIMAMQMNGDELSLLAAGDKISPPIVPLLSTTTSALQWLDSANTSLLDLNQQQPQWIATLLPNLWLDLQQSGQLPPAPTPSLEEMVQTLGSLPVQTIDLTGDSKPEALLRLDKSVLTNFKSDRPRTLIFADNGTLIYSELTGAKQRAIMGLADLGDNGLPLLVIKQGDGYTLQRWSTKTQRFN